MISIINNTWNNYKWQINNNQIENKEKEDKKIMEKCEKSHPFYYIKKLKTNWY